MPLVGGLYSGLQYRSFPADGGGAGAADDLLESYVVNNKTDSIASVFMLPSHFMGQTETPVTDTELHNRPETLDGYTPRNKKLFTFPYCFLCVDTLTDAKNYRYEWSSLRNSIQFSISCSMSPSPEIVVYPRNYNGAAYNATESVSMSGFPQCAFTVNAYQNWLAQHANGQMLGLLSSGIAAGVSALSGNVVGGVLGAIGMANQLNNMTLDATQGSRTRGAQGSSADVATRRKAIYFKDMCVTAQYAEMIDSFFDRYGYATCKLKVPNINARPHWTYTKTKDCMLHGSVPADDMAKIQGIFDKGITFWRNGSEVGNYSLDNSV